MEEASAVSWSKKSVPAKLSGADFFDALLYFPRGASPEDLLGQVDAPLECMETTLTSSTLHIGFVGFSIVTNSSTPAIIAAPICRASTGVMSYFEVISRANSVNFEEVITFFSGSFKNRLHELNFFPLFMECRLRQNLEPQIIAHHQQTRRVVKKLHGLSSDLLFALKRRDEDIRVNVGPFHFSSSSPPTSFDLFKYFFLGQHSHSCENGLCP